MGKLLEMNNFFKNIIIGLFSVRSNLTRVILTASGLTIGIFTVSIVSAAVSSIDKEFAKSMDYYGNDKVYVGTVAKLSKRRIDIFDGKIARDE